jgi:hypothetical protein
MDAVSDLGIGNVLDTPLLKIWQGEQTRQVRRQFESQPSTKLALPATCTAIWISTAPVRDGCGPS